MALKTADSCVFPLAGMLMPEFKVSQLFGSMTGEAVFTRFSGEMGCGVDRDRPGLTSR